MLAIGPPRNKLNRGLKGDGEAWVRILVEISTNSGETPATLLTHVNPPPWGNNLGSYIRFSSCKTRIFGREFDGVKFEGKSIILVDSIFIKSL